MNSDVAARRTCLVSSMTTLRGEKKRELGSITDHLFLME